jgi:SAM-dependent MidA family methyltransferase
LTLPPDNTEPFAQFMARALFDPQRGYYSRRVQTVGRDGDFSTSATLSPLLGRAIARWLKAALAQSPGVRDVIEIGAGSGALMRQVQSQLGWWTRRRWRWHIVETSERLREQQQTVLRGARVSWWTQLEEALAASAGRAMIYHNELLDAFPCRVMQWSGERWQELWIAYDEKGQVVGEQLRAGESPPWGSALQNWQPARGQRVELHETVRDWLIRWTPHWQAGQMLSIDYGDLFPAVYHRRPRGTLRGYFMQQRVEGPALYQNVGRQDLTADINFTDYRQWTRELGLRELAYTPQAAFIKAQGIRPQSELDQRLLAADGAGGAFQVVVHQCG